VKKPVIVDLILISLLLKQFRLGASSVLVQTVPSVYDSIREKIFPNIGLSVLNLTLQIFLRSL